MTTLLLLVLLSVVALGLLSLSAVSLRASRQEHAVATARANARLAMILALGELQRLAGPDARVTATADLAGTADGLPLPAGEEPGNGMTVHGRAKGLTTLRPGTRHWTGVWENADTPDDIYKRTPQPRHLGWLVSGGTPAVPGQALVKLVGQHTAGLDPERHVAAPLVDAPGAAGRFAWWVGDEGVKAKFNLAPADLTGQAVRDEKLAAPRRGWENVGGLADYPVPGDARAADAGKIISLSQAALWFPGWEDEPLRRVFHAATCDSHGVLSDVLRGGLKSDLSTAAARGDERLIPETVAPGLTNLRWPALEEFQKLCAKNNTVLSVEPATGENKAAIAPVVSDLRLLCGVKLHQQSDGFRVQPCVKIAVVLANPHSLPLRWDAPLEIEFLNATDPRRQPTRIFGAGGLPAIVPQWPGEPAVLNRAVFTIAPGVLPPGEARAFTQGAPTIRSLLGATSRVEIPLSAFSPAHAGDFSNAVILNHPARNTLSGEMGLELREDQITSQVDVEMRLAGKPGILRRIERLELDNPCYDIMRRTLTRDLAARFTRPFPLQFYHFHLSRPGESRQPASRQGLSGSTLRTYADFNIRATRFRKPLICYTPPPYALAIAESADALPFDPPGGDTGADFTSGLRAGPQPWGFSADGPERAVLFDVPRGLASIAQFQHADLTADDDAVSVAHQPGNAVGNSYATPFVRRSLSIQKRSDHNITGFTTYTSRETNYHDMSYLLNAALWDGSFFSTMQPDAQGKPLNPRMVATDARTDGPPAARLLVDGAFNINSVEKDAWIALLAGARHMRHPADSGNDDGALFSRSLGQPLSAADPPSGRSDEAYAGFRRLSDAQIERVAKEIARQVRLRGPFLSLSHFVNRALVDVEVSAELGRCGALQAALDSGANVFTDLNEDHVLLQAEADGSPRADMPGTDPTRWPDEDGTWPSLSRDENPGSVAGIVADRGVLTNETLRPEQGCRSTGIPGWITQADVLQVIGPSLAARSDTFRIRACGEAVDPATGKTAAKAWCEAMVQRMPGYLDETDPPEARGDQLAETNRRFGRRFHIISFRWLAENEI